MSECAQRQSVSNDSCVIFISMCNCREVSQEVVYGGEHVLFLVYFVGRGCVNSYHSKSPR